MGVKMAKIISMFNHKGGVSKTTTSFHLGWALAEKHKRVLLIDADPQSNLTSLALSIPDEDALEELYNRKNSNDIYSLVKPLMQSARIEISKNDTLSNIVASKCENLYILPGHLQIEEFSNQLTLALSMGISSDFSIFRNFPGYLIYAFHKIAEFNKIDYIIIDMAPSLSALNQVLVMGSDYLISPCSPDFFSELAIKNLSKILPDWQKKCSAYPFDTLSLNCKPKFLGIIQQNYRPRKTKQSDDKNTPTQSFKKWVERVGETTRDVLVPVLQNLDMSITYEQFSDFIHEQVPFNLSLIPDFNSLIATSQLSNKPVFNLTEEDIKAYSNIYGAAMATTKESIDKFRSLFNKLANDLETLMQNI